MKSIYILLAFSIALFSCSGEAEMKVEDAEVEIDPIDTFEERVAEIDRLSKLSFSDSLSLDFSDAHGEKLLAAYEDYIKFHSFEADSKDFQYKAGELAIRLNKPHIAIKHFNDLLERDPKHTKAGMALFSKAMVIGDMLHEDELAKRTYQEFIDKYPDDPFVPSAKASIELQGKSLNDIVAGFEKENS